MRNVRIAPLGDGSYNIERNNVVLMTSLKRGSIIRSNYWTEPVEIESVEELGDYFRIIGATSFTRQHIDSLIPREDFSKFSIEELTSDFSSEPWQVFLGLESIRYRFASMYDPLLAMNVSKVNPLPHQIEAVYGSALQYPRIRFMIADDPGAGKTIMAGLIIKEMQLRHLINRILIVSPGHLKDQWRRELHEKFKERFVVIDRGILDTAYGENVWQRENHIITSIDFAKREDVLPSIASASFDLIIVDEAHKMSAYRFGDKVNKTGRYKLGETLSKLTEHLLFLTATPHKGDPENFRLLLDLLEPGFYATNEMLQQAIQDDENKLFIRRLKEDLKDFDGKPLFLPRYVKTISFNYKYDSPKEQELYNKLSKYVETQYNKALQKDKKRNVAFALVILQRRLASSTFALWKSLERRKKKLQELWDDVQNIGKVQVSTFDFEEIEDMSEEDRMKEEELWETLSVAENREELEKEISILNTLILKAKDIIQNEEEIKVKELKKSLEMLRDKFSDEADKKIIIFTEAKDTLTYLDKKIQSWGYRTNTIHGGMKLEDRVEAESIFKNETQILVATEAAGEGINLQFCHLMINYDIPWNPNRLEQRMGRIHRYGQMKEVYIFNLVAEDTREGRVLKRLFEKLDEIREALKDKVFDVLGDVLYDIHFSQLLVEAAANARDIEEILKGIDIIADEEYISKVKAELSDSLAKSIIDYTRIKEIAQKAREHRLIPEYTETFFKKAFERAGGKIRERRDGFFGVDSIPYGIRNVTEKDDFKKSFGSLLRRYPKITFDKDMAFKQSDAEFVSFGHPLFEAVMAWIEKNFLNTLMNGAVFIDPDGKIDGHILFYEGQIHDGTSSIAGKRLFAFFLDEKDIVAIPPDIIWDIEEGKEKLHEVIDVETVKKRATGAAISKLKEYNETLQQDRNKEAEIKQKYGVKSLEYLILKLDGELIPLYERKAIGDNVDLAIRNKEERKRGYETALEELKDTIIKEKSLSMSMPRFIGIIRVLPGEVSGVAMKSDKEIERIGMEETMKHERREGRIPEDVSAENLGFDVRSRAEKNDKVLYIEVKARAQTASVELTKNEWFKARRFKDDYYLYAVMNAGSSPKLYIIQNPAEKFSPEERVEVVRYHIPLNEILEKGVSTDE